MKSLEHVLTRVVKTTVSPQQVASFPVTSGSGTQYDNLATIYLHM